jgi:phosphoglycolate phosphatase-like HAD superfamily hydrolase
MYKWTTGINTTIARMVHGVAPFPYVRESLQKLSDKADMVCVSATPVEALTREWEEHDIAQYVALICGQEQGKKAEHLCLASGGQIDGKGGVTQLGSRYPEGRILMVGDAPGDMKAARANHALFYPINPGHEEGSWQRFHEEAADKFLNEEYAGDYEAKVIAEFESYLPDTPPWKK